MGEFDFYGKTVRALNGYLLYSTDPKYVGVVRFFHYSLENELKNGTNTYARFYYCRSTEMENKQTSTDRTSGRIFAWENVVPNGIWSDGTTFVDLASIDVTEAYSWEDALNKVKQIFDSGDYESGEEPWKLVLPSTNKAGGFAKIVGIGRSANANLTGSGEKTVHYGSAIVYYKNIAYKPYDEIYYKVTDDMTILLSETTNWEYVTPTIFDIDANSAIITLDASYCCLAIDKFDVIQHTGKTAIVIDKLGNTIFDGTSLGPGVYHFKCSFVPYKYGDVYITMENGTQKYCYSNYLANLYSGYNEKWNISKEELIEPTSS